MKKTIVLLILTLVLMTACAPAQSQSSQTSGNGLACMQIVVLGSLEEFEAYISNKQLPDNFVRWNDISGLGRRISFIPTNEFPQKYKYDFYDAESEQTDKNTQSIQLTITHSTEEDNLTTSKKYNVIPVTRDMTDMRLVPSCSGTSVIIRHGIEYQYQPLFDAKPGDPAGLNKITWYHDGVKFELTGQLQTFSSPLIHKLLSISETEAAAAFAEIKAALTK